MLMEVSVSYCLPEVIILISYSLFYEIFIFVGKYQGQWQEGKRHGYGIRTSAPFGLASHHRRKEVHASSTSLRSNENLPNAVGKSSPPTEEIRGGFVLTVRSDNLPVRRNSLSEKPKKGFLSVNYIKFYNNYYYLFKY